MPDRKQKRKLTKGNKSMVGEINRLWDFVWSSRVAENAPGWTDHPDGRMPPPAQAGGTYVPPLSPTLSANDVATALSITSGWVNAPADDADDLDHEIQTHCLSASMPLIGATRLDADPAPALLMDHNDTNYVYLTVTLTRLESTIGDTLIDGYTGIVGNTVWVSDSYTNLAVTSGSDILATITMPATEIGTAHSHTIAFDDPGGGHNHDHGGTTGSESSHTHDILDVDLPVHTHDIIDATHTHEAMGQMTNLSYYVAQAPVFNVNQTGFPDDTELVKNIPWGRYVIDVDGANTVEEWYRRDHLDYYPPNYVRSAMSVGHNGAQDITVNPRTVAPV